MIFKSSKNEVESMELYTVDQLMQFCFHLFLLSLYYFLHIFLQKRISDVIFTNRYQKTIYTLIHTLCSSLKCWTAIGTIVEERSERNCRTSRVMFILVMLVVI